MDLNVYTDMDYYAVDFLGLGNSIDTALTRTGTIFKQLLRQPPLPCAADLRLRLLEFGLWRPNRFLPSAVGLTCVRRRGHRARRRRAAAVQQSTQQSVFTQCCCTTTTPTPSCTITTTTPATPAVSVNINNKTQLSTSTLAPSTGLVGQCLPVRMGLFNVRGATQKCAMINDIMNDNDLNVLAVVETWIKEDAPPAIKNDLAPPGYSVLHTHRSAVLSGRTRGGGLAFIYSNNMSASLLKSISFQPSSFEVQLISLRIGQVAIKIVIVYRPPSSSVSTFYDEFADLLTMVEQHGSDRLVICGDFNLPGTTSYTVDERLNSLLDIRGYQQQVAGPTRHDAVSRISNLLDLVITPQSSNISPLVSNVLVHNSHGLSDHDIITFDLAVRRHKRSSPPYQYRNLKQIDLHEFSDKLLNSELYSDPSEDPDIFVDQLERTVIKILDELAPLRIGKRPNSRKSARWLSPEAVNAKKHRRRLERRWKSTGAECDRIDYRKACRHANKLINESRNTQRYHRLIECKDNARHMWSAVKDLLHGGTVTDSQTDDKLFCQTLSSFFTSKIHDIKSAIKNSLLSDNYDPFSSDKPFSSQELSEFLPVSADEVKKVIGRMPGKSSPLDVVPTSLLKSCVDVFSPIIAHLANISFSCGHFPTTFKKAQITPLIKKPGLDCHIPANYRPISNLSTISKLLERLVLTRIMSHIKSSSATDTFQSAYRTGYSTETALLRVTNDILAAIDTQQSVILVALDQSAAFDCIDHDILIRRLEYSFGITGDALNWMRSYLQSRSSFVRLQSSSSDITSVEYGVPQGSSLGPLLFSLYIAPIANLIQSHHILHHQYADDTQVYIATTKQHLASSLSNLENCISDIHKWLSYNGLSLNPTKSDAIQFSTRQFSRCCQVDEVNVSGAVIKPSTSVKSLGVTLDRHMTFDEHITNVCRSCYFHMKALRHIRPSLPEDIARTVGCSIICSRLDYCNSLYSGLSVTNLNRLQRVQNDLARVVLGLKKFDHITAGLMDLHWLPIKYRIDFKIAALTYKILNTYSPSYLFDVLTPYFPPRDLRSSNRLLLTVPTSKTVIGSRSFSHSAPIIWNALPLYLRDCNTFLSFRKKLKTLFFNNAFKFV